MSAFCIRKGPAHRAASAWLYRTLCELCFKKLSFGGAAETRDG